VEWGKFQRTSSESGASAVVEKRQKETAGAKNEQKATARGAIFRGSLTFPGRLGQRSPRAPWRRDARGGIILPLRYGAGRVLPVAAGAACPRLHGMAESGGEPTDRPKPSRAERQQRVPLVAKLRTVKGALASTPLADENTFLLCHNGRRDTTSPAGASCMAGLNPGNDRVTGGAANADGAYDWQRERNRRASVQDGSGARLEAAHGIRDRRRSRTRPG